MALSLIRRRTAMDVEYRPLTADDYEQAAHLEATAFYNRPTPDRLERMRAVFPPDWTLGAFIDGRLVADVRTIPMARRVNGRGVTHGAVGPVACLAEHRRRGYVGSLLRLALEDMRRRGIATSGLHTPHDALYRRFGWDRAEAKRRYVFHAKDVRLRFRGGPGTLEPVTGDDWQRLDAVYRRYAGPRNGPLHRPEPWWRFAVLQDVQDQPRDALVWRSAHDQDEGFIVYSSEPAGEPFRHNLFVRDVVSVSGDAYLGLWQHLASHDIASRIAVDAPVNDPFPDLLEDPWRIQIERGEGAMLRIVDVERALSMRPYIGHRPVSFTMRVVDPTASWNDGLWRVEASDGHMEARLAGDEPDLELSVNFLAPLFTGLLRADEAAQAGMIQVHNDAALGEVTEAFAVTYPPYCNDFY